jgi:hypothetical protein
LPAEKLVPGSWGRTSGLDYRSSDSE